MVLKIAENFHNGSFNKSEARVQLGQVNAYGKTGIYHMNHETDFVLLAVAAVALYGVLAWRFWPGWRRAALSGALALAVLGAGWSFVEQSGRRESARLEKMAMGYAPIFADGLARLKHEQITTETSSDDPLYWQLAQAEKRWLSANPEIANILTFRKHKDGRLAILVESSSAAAGAGAGEPKKTLGVTFDRDLGTATQKIFAGETAFQGEPTTDAQGTWVTAFAPIHNFRGDVDAFVAVDFAAGQWIAAIDHARYLAIGCVAAVLLVIALGSVPLGQRLPVPTPVRSTRPVSAPRPITAPAEAPAPVPPPPAAPIQKQEQEAASMDRQKLETLVDSIDGIVFESAVPIPRFTFISRQCERLLGYAPGQWTAAHDFWSTKLDPADAWAPIRRQKLIEAGAPYSLDYRMTAADGRTVWIRENAAVMYDAEQKPLVVRGVFYDITGLKSAASELEKANAALVESSRFAGMAEVATGVLHNVGNVLNSVNVSGNVISERLRRSKVIELGKVAGLLTLQAADFAGFVARDPRGPHIPELISCVAEALKAEHAELLEEVDSITRNIAHIKEIVAMQQGFAKGHGITEPLVIQTLVDDAIKINSVSFTRHRITVVQAYEEVPEVLVDKHLVLQILVNLLRNAKQAIEASSNESRRIVVKIQNQGGECVRIAVQDTGNGIAPEHLTRIFSHGFTTKKTGHGFGLHASALAATGMGGSLQAQSDGPGTGATFVLELPVLNRAPVAVPEPVAVAA
jgi:PAS domain S-box-containing protein